jgi:hypothetical protein
MQSHANLSVQFTPAVQSVFGVESLGKWVVIGVPFAELVIVVLSLVPLIQMQVEVSKEMVMVLGTYEAIRARELLMLLLMVFVGVNVVGLVLSQLVVVVLVVKVFVGVANAFVGRVPEVVNHFLEACARLALLHDPLIQIGQIVGVYLQLVHLLVDVLHRLLDVALLAISGEAKRFERRQGP